MMQKGLLFSLSVLLVLSMAGCNKDILDPTDIGRFEPTPLVNVILPTLGIADEPAPGYEGAEDPKPEDLVSYERDYVLGSGDVVRISIFELYQEFTNYVNDYVITETGRVSIPDVGVVRAGGLTEEELEREIAKILSPNIIKDPSVTVTSISSQSRFVSIMGQGIGQAGRYTIPRYTYRLTDAIADAGNIGDFNVTHIYVSRDVPADSVGATSGENLDLQPVSPDTRNAEDEMLELITPSVKRNNNGLLITSAEMSTRQELEMLAAPEGIDPLIDYTASSESVDALLPERSNKRIEWQFENGKWVPVEVDGEVADRSPMQPELLLPENIGPMRARSEGAAGSDIGETSTITRVIVIPADKLLAGDPHYNIVIRPGDRVIVPRDKVGEFVVTGNVNAPNMYPITGRDITLKMAVAIAGGLNELAWPKKVEVVRRLGKNEAGMDQEEIVMVDLEKIAKGLQPDFYIKQNDYIYVGTHGTSRWLAGLRNAFRATYGFGLIYDRNFATRDFDGNPWPF